MPFLLLLVSALAALQPQPRSWAPEERVLPASVADSDPHTYEVFCQGSHSDPIDIGLSWAAPQRLGAVEVDYATLGGRAYEPAVAGQRLEYWTGSAWRPLTSELEIDYRARGQFAPVQGNGIATWRYRFSPVETDRIRLVLTVPRNEESWQRCYAVRELRAGGATTGSFAGAGVRVLGEEPGLPAWLEPGANLAVAEAGAVVELGRSAGIRWPRKFLVNRIEVEPALDGLRAFWWDGAGWREVEPLPAPARGVLRFLPLATSRLRVVAARGAIAGLRARLDPEAARYFRELERARTDLAGARFRRHSRPDLAAMRSLLLPLDFAKAALGRPADRTETMVTWNGTFLMTETAPPAPDKPVLDRWFAFAIGDAMIPFGADWTTADTRYLEGYLPATVTTSTRGGLRLEETLWVTSPGEPVYGTAAEVRVTNSGEARAKTVLTVAMGRRPYKPKSPHPLSYAPEPTRYRLDADRRTVRSAEGDIVLYAEKAGEWGGTLWESHLSYALELAPGESQTLRFLAPSVEAPLQSSAALETFDWKASLGRFRAFWNQKLGEGLQIELPEPELNAIYKNLLAQSLIITLDGDSVVQYGAYSYESYFGLEEGWPAVALAQFGYPEEAKKIASIMLSPRHMDKKNYHHQYRNGLAPFYAVTVYRLTGDRKWLESIAGDLEAAAEWTIRTIHENRDPRFGGLLPRHAYGGDISAPAYSLYSNATCWRGLNDTALALRILGRMEQAERYQREADRYRKRLWELADQLADTGSRPVFLPMSFDVGSGAEYRDKEPAYAMLGINVPPSNTWVYLGNYWNLFAPCFQELKLFEASDPRSRWVPDYMAARGGILAGLVRFTIGLDQIYGKGYYESLLEQGKRDEFLTSLYGIFAHGMSSNLYSFPEVAGVWPLRTDNAAMWREHRRNLWDWGFQGWDWNAPGWVNSEGEPLSAGPGMALQLLRMALVRETIESTPQDGLRLLDGAPRHWLEPGARIRVIGANTFFGKVSLETEASAGKVVARISLPSESPPREVILRLPHPEGKPLREVTLNGQRWSDFSGEEIRLPRSGRLELTAVY
jgi:hypothetical protein